MSEYINDQKDKFLSDASKLQARRLEWPQFERRALELINSYISDGQKSNHYESLYVVTDKDIPNRSTTNQSFIQFYAGSHPTGISTTVLDTETRMEQLSSVSEHSGCLSIAQEPRGGVFFIAYPSKSDVLKWKDEYVMLKTFKSPSAVEWYDIKKAIEFYLRFARYTSMYSEQTTREKIELWWIKFKFSSIISYIFNGSKFALRVISTVKTGQPTQL